RQLDVGRSAVREALKTLELKGLLQVRRGYGGGTFVRHPGPDSVPHELHTNPGLDADVYDVLTVRLQLEPMAARLAALRGAVARGDGESAESAMRSHLTTLTALLLARREVESGQAGA